MTGIKRHISPDEFAERAHGIQEIENQHEQLFGGMDTDQFVDQGISIFRAAAEGMPAVNPAADLAVRGLLRALLIPEAPVPFMGGQTASAWRVYTEQLIDRIAANKDVSLRDVPADYGKAFDEAILDHIDLGDQSPEEYWEAFQVAWTGLQGQEAVDG